MGIPSGFKGSPLRFRLEKWFWSVLTLAVVVADIWFPVFWGRISIVYLAVVSNYALVATFAGCEQAAEAKQNAAEAIDTGGTPCSSSDSSSPCSAG